MTDLTALKLEIDYLIGALDASMNEISRLDHFIQTTEDPDASYLMVEVLMNKAKLFEELGETTRLKVKAYLDERKAQNLPADFSLTRFLNQIAKE